MEKIGGLHPAKGKGDLGNEYRNHELVFAQPNGNPIDIQNLNKKKFKPLLAKAGLPHIRFYDLRHTAATFLLAGGVLPKILSKLLGTPKWG